MKRFLKNKDGATSIEYGLIVALIVIAVVVIISEVGTKMATSYNNTAAAFN